MFSRLFTQNIAQAKQFAQRYQVEMDKVIGASGITAAAGCALENLWFYKKNPEAKQIVSQDEFCENKRRFSLD